MTDSKWDGPLGIICDAIAECQALLHDNPPDVLARVSAELESDRLRAMYDIGYLSVLSLQESPPRPRFRIIWERAEPRNGWRFLRRLNGRPARRYEISTVTLSRN